jgi:drug/metabolite transporter (DMT)-like permease
MARVRRDVTLSRIDDRKGVASPPEKTTPSNVRIWAALCTVYLVWGSTYLAIRVAVTTLPPLLTTGVRFLVAGLCLLGWVRLRRGRSALRVTRSELRAATLVGIALVGANGLVMIAEQEVPSSLAALIISSVPLWVVLMRRLAGEPLSAGSVVGVIAGFAGVAILLLPGGHVGGGAGGFALIVLASVSWATGSFFSKRMPLPSDPLGSTSLQMVGGGAVLLVAGVLRGEPARVDPSSFAASSLAAFAYLIVVGSLLAFTTYVWLLQNAPLGKVATYAYVNPVVAIVLGAVILGEATTPVTLMGAAIIVASVASIVRQESKPSGPPPEGAGSSLAPLRAR